MTLPKREVRFTAEKRTSGGHNAARGGVPVWVLCFRALGK